MFGTKQTNKQQINAWVSSKVIDLDIFGGIFNMVYWHIQEF